MANVREIKINEKMQGTFDVKEGIKVILINNGQAKEIEITHPFGGMEIKIHDNKIADWEVKEKHRG